MKSDMLKVNNWQLTVRTLDKELWVRVLYSQVLEAYTVYRIGILILLMSEVTGRIKSEKTWVMLSPLYMLAILVTLLAQVTMFLLYLVDYACEWHISSPQNSHFGQKDSGLLLAIYLFVIHMRSYAVHQSYWDTRGGWTSWLPKNYKF